MNLATFFDTETTGLPIWSQPSEAPEQPHIVQLAACLVDLDTRKVLQSIDLMVRPAGWIIPAETTEVHGISQEMAMDLGVPEALAVEALLELCATMKPAGERRLRIAHNEQFDARIVRIAIKREFSDENMAEAWKDSPAACTARLSTPICALPPTDKMKASRMAFKHKTPNLGEAYKHFTGRDIENAHSALSDVHGCMAVWFGIQDMERAAVAA